MKIFFAIFFSCVVSQAMSQQRLRDSLFGGKLKADTAAKYVSTDTSKYQPTAIKNETVSSIKNEAVTSTPGERKRIDPNAPVNKVDESMPDSLNKLYYAKQRQWKRFVETNVPIITQAADDSRKVKKGTYEIEVEYEVGLNGRITTKGITCNPSNEFLQEQVTELMKRAPVLSPPIYSDGKPRTLTATQPITIVKK